MASLASVTPVWSETYTIRSYDLGVTAAASLPALCRFFLETAGNHAYAAGVGMKQLFAQGLTWVLQKLYLRVEHYPRWRDEVRIRTWPTGSKRYYAYRDFVIQDTQGRNLALGNSVWLIIHQRQRSPELISRHFQNLPVSDRLTAIPQQPPRIPTLPHYAGCYELNVRFSELDINRHATSVAYINWLLDAMPDATRLTLEPIELSLHFINEALVGDALTACAQPGQETALFYHQVKSREDGREICRAQSRWRRRAHEETADL